MRRLNIAAPAAVGLIAMSLAIGAFPSTAATAPSDGEKLAILWADYCGRTTDPACAIPVPSASPAPSIAPSPSPPPVTPTPSPSPSPSPAPTATATPTPSPISSVRVSSIPALLSALANDGLDEIVVTNGTYHVSRAGLQAADSLWIGSRFAARTRPVLIRAESTGGVTFDGGGTGYFGGITFVEGAHHQTWQGFRFANGRPTQTGVVVFGGYAGLAAPHHITLRDIAILNSVRVTTPGSNQDHAIYFSQAVGGPHDLLIDGLTVDSPVGGVYTALHFYHSDAANRNAWNVVIRRMRVSGTDQAVMMWDATAQARIEDSTITGAREIAVSYERGTLALVRVTSTGSGQYGFYSSKGATPPGVTFIESDLR